MEGRDAYGFLACKRVRHVEKLDDEIPTDFRYSWKNPDAVQAYKKKGEQERATVCDGSSYWAALLTHAKFGCVLHEGME